MDDVFKAMAPNNIPVLIATAVIILAYKFASVLIDKYRDQKAVDKHDKLIDMRKTIGDQIESCLEHALIRTQASRCFVFEYHNGTSSLSGLPFLKMTNTYEAVAAGITPQIGNLQALSCNLYQRFLKTIESQSHALYDVKNRDGSFDAISYGTLEAQNISKTLIARMVDEKQRVIGYVGLDYCNGHDNYQDDHKTTVIELATKIGAFLTVSKT